VVSDDPQPMFRCRCVHRMRFAGSDHEFSFYAGADPYYDRCPTRPTQEDGMCDHCRPSECVTCDDSYECCLHPNQRRQIVDLMTPCLDRSPTEVPF
jgi:hypothetical protein